MEYNNNLEKQNTKNGVKHKIFQNKSSLGIYEIFKLKHRILDENKTLIES